MAIIFKRAAIATESMIVLQMTYLGLLGPEKVLEGWAGLQINGKYSGAYNPELVEVYPISDLSSLELDGQLINNYNLSLAIVAILAIIILVYRIRQSRKF